MSISSVLPVTSSSAISEISFDYDEKEVGVTFISNPDKSYIFICDNPIDVETQLRTAESIGKLISQLKKDGTLKST